MGDQLTTTSTVFIEFYYWVTVVMMFLIHVGFCVYETGVSRRRQSHEDAYEKHDGHSFE